MGKSWYEALRAWITLNYELKSDSYTKCNDLHEHANAEKENLGCLETISQNLLSRAIAEIFPGVKKCRLRREGSKPWVFFGLSLKCNDSRISREPERMECDQEWELLLTSKAQEIVAQNPNWSFKCLDNNTLSFIHVEDVRFERQLCVCEIVLKINDTRSLVEFCILYHEREVPKNTIQGILTPLQYATITERVINLMTIMENSYTCQGFEMNHDEILYGVPLKKVKITSFCEDDVPEQLPRAFSPTCRVLANSGGILCDSCVITKSHLKRKQSRKNDRISTGGGTANKTNHSIMKMCIELYSKNPHVLDPIRKVLLLPSNRTIRCYKNKVDQAPGWNDNLLQWCLEEAKKANLRKEDYWGAFVLDEMKIQEDIQMVIKGGKHRLVGFVDPGKVHDDMEVLSGRFYVMYL
ncbi:hypothetical protein AC249_AIPGENE28430 [Exaiptasia diaphana]|nr:hypothetical protein AC249_AIPGENE28430 [Exaiptasia diaphana]